MHQGLEQIKPDHAAPHWLRVNSGRPLLSAWADAIAGRITVRELAKTHALFHPQHRPGVVKVVIGGGKAKYLVLPIGVFRGKGADRLIRARRLRLRR